jgi:hypothetical protein
MIAAGKDPGNGIKRLLWRFKRLKSGATSSFPSTDPCYIQQLILVEHWIELDSNKGKMILESLKTG